MTTITEQISESTFPTIEEDEYYSLNNYRDGVNFNKFADPLAEGSNLKDVPLLVNTPLTEEWDGGQNILHAHVYDVSDQTVGCDCIVDEETQLMEKRTFPRLIFDAVPNLKEGSLVIVDIKQKAGSIRIDIKNGKGIVDPQKFELESLIDSLKDF